MSDLTLADLAKKMAKLDFATLNTVSSDGALSGRPMSNNGDVDYQGDSYFFAYSASRKVAEIRANARVSLSYSGAIGLLGGSPLFIDVAGAAALIADKSQYAEHWSKDLDRYFPDGIDTPNMVLIHVRAETIRYWDGEDEGVVTL